MIIKNYKKPRIGSTVYCIYKDSIIVEKVAFVGTDSFIIEDWGPGFNEDSWEWFYEDHNRNWFTNLSEAKEQIKTDFAYCVKQPVFIKRNEHDRVWYELLDKVENADYIKSIKMGEI